MYIPFQSLPPDARVWVYQSDKLLTKEQQQIISDGLHTFTEQWMVHGVPMETSFRIVDDHFVILAANDKASGCSIDSSVRVIREIGQRIGVDFFNRNLIAFRLEDKVRLINLKEIKTTLAKGDWNAQSLYYNNVIQSAKELGGSWPAPVKDSWLSRYLDKQIVSD